MAIDTDESDIKEPDTGESKAPFLPPRWVITSAWKAHRALYRWSGGRFGLREASGDQYGLAQLITIGRRTGEERAVMIGYFHDGDDFVTMAMNGWGAPEPAWWLNLQAQPNARLVTGDGVKLVTAHVAEDSEHDRLWKRWAEIDEGLDQLAAKRPGRTAVVILRPSS